tara:strand:- start:18589 stop:18975 length:387 start_codon:yes stop_codon:yes gene_type:complete
MKLSITADSASGTKTLATAKTLRNLARRLVKDAGFWRDMGWEAFQLEGYNVQDALAALRAKEISHEEYRTLRDCAKPDPKAIEYKRLGEEVASVRRDLFQLRDSRDQRLRDAQELLGQAQAILEEAGR